MNEKILVHLYLYKSSEIVHVIDELIANAKNPENVFIYVDDQNNLTRYPKLFKHKNVFYNPVWWDELSSPLSYRDSCLQVNGDKYGYFLFLNNETYLPKNWDLYLKESTPTSSVLSGKGIVSCLVEDNFYIKKYRTESSDISLANIVDNGFIFGKIEDILKIKLPANLKYYGIDEYISIALLNKGISIYSLPSSFYISGSDNLIAKDYIPFSLHHNYNDLIKMIKGIDQNGLVYEDPDKFVQSFNLDVSQLHELPFSFNDIEYNRFSELDLIGGKRYIEKRDTVS